MSEPETESRMLTLSEVSQRTGISMPTLQRYKKIYQGRIPAEGKGRKQRYPESALPVFDELKNENAGRRGRPRKNAAAAPAAAAGRRGRKPAAAAPAPAKKTPGRRGRPPGSKSAKSVKSAKKAAAAPARRGRKAAGARAGRASSGLLTLGQVSEQTGISYPTLVRYVRMHSDRLPSEGAGRSRRFRPEAVDVFRQLRQESGRGGRKPAAAKVAAGRRGPGRPRGRAAAAPAAESGLAQRLHSLERTQQELEKKLRGFVQSVQKFFR